MVGKRKAEARDVREWQAHGEVAAANELDKVRTWVVWGVGADPSNPARAAAPLEPPRGRPGNDIARTIAEEHDEEWTKSPHWDRWFILYEADEDDVDAWSLEDERVRGYAPYLVPAKA